MKIGECQILIASIILVYVIINYLERDSEGDVI